ncbi:MAG: acetyl-CoA carboxylase carboxyltransferase subunit alpha [Ruminococcus sp.]|nr:acetyl-CoA carboxylase carboxyltransferase subunit alpha [Ruminococcus sp.]
MANTTNNTYPAYEKVLAARDASKLTAVDFIQHMFGDSFFELHGDRRFSDDKAIVAGLAKLYEMPVTVIGIEKGRNTKERMERNFGQAHPEGYRKALRLIKQAEKFRRPVLCLVDTSGAFPGIGAEERGQGQAIAENLMEMMTLKTPVLTILIGEGGSGGALALAVADEVWMLENSVYSVISPEGCASILWKDSAKAPQAAEALKMTAQDLFRLGVVERIIRQPKADDLAMFESLKLLVMRTLEKNLALPDAELLQRRYDRFRKIGAQDAQE